LAVIKCPECGKEISSLAAACPSCGAPNSSAPQSPPVGSAAPAPPKRKVGIWLGLGIFFLPPIFSWFTLRSGHSVLSRVLAFGWLGVLGLAALVDKPPATTADAPNQSPPKQAAVSVEQPKQAAVSVEQPKPAQPAPAPPPAPPTQQQQFLALIDDFAAKYKAADNEMAQGALRPQRAKAVCALLGTGQVKDWVGTVQELSSNNEGKGVLAVSMSKIAKAKTWNNAVSDYADNTLIEPGTPLHKAAIQLKKRQTIFFSGTFVKGDTDCFRESSLTQEGSMKDPDWIFRFSTVKPAE
jgi:hypothetical protein